MLSVYRCPKQVTLTGALCIIDPIESKVTKTVILLKEVLFSEMNDLNGNNIISMKIKSGIATIN
jgi:hypothetical protein